MNHFELRAALRVLGFRQADLMWLCGMSRDHACRIYNGKVAVPEYVATIMYLMNGESPWDIKRKQVVKFEVEHCDVYRGESYKDLALRFHPDRSGKDTTAEMQIINSFRR